MKVILRQDVETLGRRGDVVEVADGYARNFLIPRALAVHASKGNLRTLEEHKASIERERGLKKAEAEKLAQELGKLNISITAKSGEKDKLYGSVTSKDIAEAIEKLSSIKIDRKKIALKEDIKTAGKHEATIDLYPEVQAKLIVEVVGEKKRKTENAKRKTEKKTKETREKKEKKEKKESKSGS